MRTALTTLILAMFVTTIVGCQSEYQRGHAGGVNWVRRARAEGMMSIGLVRANVALGNYMVPSTESPDYQAGWRKGISDELSKP
jgi:hypothetical protein